MYDKLDMYKVHSLIGFEIIAIIKVPIYPSLPEVSSCLLVIPPSYPLSPQYPLSHP